MAQFDENANRIESLDRHELEARLRDAARGLFPERLIDDLEVRHLIRVLTECPGVPGDPYSEKRLEPVIRQSPPRYNVLDSLLELGTTGEESFHRVCRLPDEVRIVGDRALFDHGLLGLQRVRGYDLVDLGAQAYRRAAELLELLAEDRRLQEFFQQNQLLMLPLEQEVVFLQQCSEKFREYAGILKHTHGPEGVADVSNRVPLMAAVAEALVADPPEEQAVPEPDEIESGGATDEYAEAARGEVAGEARISRERLVSNYERILLFSGLDMSKLREALDTTVIDQQGAVDRLCDEFSLFAAGTRDQRKPPAYFLVGPTGVGKNHLIESLIRLLEGVWGIEVPMLTIEGPNYTYPSDINELRGATRGFIRSDEDGILTTFHERSRRTPLGVILVDEVEKAHPHLLTFFLSILDRGTTTDNRGNVLNFANCIVFFTSNLGYSDAQQGSRTIGYGDEQDQLAAADGVVRRGLRQALRPEFINRVRTVHFSRLGRSSAERILELELSKIAKRYRDVHDLGIQLHETAREELIRRGFSETYGARHLASTLEAVCNVDIAKKVRRDDRSDQDDRRRLIGWLREIRVGERPFAVDEIKRRVLQKTRARLDYDTLIVAYRDGQFVFDTEQRN